MPTRRQEKRRKAAAQTATAPRSAPVVAAEMPLTAPAIPGATADIGATQFAGRLRHAASATIAHRAFPVAAVVAIYITSFAVYAALSRSVLPNLFPDEMFYSKLSQNFAWGDGLTWRGSGWGLPPLWPMVLSLSWHTGSVPEGYDVAKFLCAAVISTTVVPVWLLGRTLVGPRLALVPAALTVMGAWMQVTEFMASENLAFPLATAALASTVMAVRDTRTRWMAISVGFGLLAALARTQMLVLPAILVLALILDVARQPRGSRRARFDARPRAFWIGLTVAVVGVLAAFIVKPDLTNYDLLANHASVVDVAKTAGRHSASSIVAFAFIPVAAAFALMTRKANWRDDNVGPVLVTLVAGIVVLYPVVARFEVWATVGSPVERYTMYLAPLVFMAFVLAPGRISRTAALVFAVGVGAALFASPLTQNYLEQPAVFGTQTRLYRLSGFVRHHQHLGLVLAALPVTIAGTLALTNRRRTVGFAAAVALVAGVMFAQDYTSQSLERNAISSHRYDAVPHQLDWVDRHATGDVAMIAVAKPQPWRPNIDLYSEMFNRKIKYMYSTLPVGNGACDVDLKKRGVIAEGTDYCRGFPRDWLILKGPIALAFHGQRVLATSRHHGTLVEIPAGAPRVLGLVSPPCTATGCTGQLQLGLYVDAPTKVAVTFAASLTDHRVQTGNQIRTLPARRTTTLNFNIPKGDQAVNLPVDWTSPQDGPPLKSVVLTTAGKRTRIY